MKHAIQKIDRAIKNLYRLDNQLQATDFLVRGGTSLEGGATSAVGNRLGKGALLILEANEPSTVEVGLYFDSEVKSQLQDFEKWPRAEWTKGQVQAFAVASEEISHFNYLAERAIRDQRVSALELEVQGEVDRFVLAFLAERLQRKTPSFEELFALYFERFHWAPQLDETQKSRYEQAHRVASAVIRKLRPGFKNPRQWNLLLRELRAFYHSGPAEKFFSAQR